MKFFQRQYRVTVGNDGSNNALQFNTLDVKFKATKSIPANGKKAKPNTCTIEIWNLNADHRAALATPKKVPLRLEAGYKDGMGVIYLGEIRALESRVEGPDVITKLSTGDSLKEIQKARLNVGIPPGARTDEILAMLVEGLGVGAGNVQQAMAKLRATGSADVFGKRSVISGHAAQELTDFCRSAGIEWSIQDGKMQLLDLNKPLEGTAIEISPDSGLIGSPTVDHLGFVEAKVLLLPILNPGRLVSFNAENLKGGYRIIHVEYEGDTYGQDWFAKITCQKLTKVVTG